VLRPKEDATTRDENPSAGCHRSSTAVACVEDSPKLINLHNKQFAVHNAGPSHLTTGIVEAARAGGRATSISQKMWRGRGATGASG
jgi:hypothetical protein